MSVSLSDLRLLVAVDVGWLVREMVSGGLTEERMLQISEVGLLVLDSGLCFG